MITARSLDIPLVVVGCDFRNAAVSFREVLVTTADERAKLLHGIQSVESGAGLATLETCNRIEWFASTDSPEWVGELLSAAMMQRWRKSHGDTTEYPSPYVYSGRRAARHLLRVVAGLESLAAGEAQIAGQFQDALQRAREECTASDILNGLTSVAGRLAKSGYRVGFRADHHRGIHGMTVDYLLERLGGVAEGKTVIVAGMGSIGRKVAEICDQTHGLRVIRANRTVREEHEGQWAQLDALQECVQQADALVVATGGLTPVIQPQHVGLDSRETPLIIVDIGIPTQVSARVQQMEGVQYHNLDNLVERFGQSGTSRSVSEVEAEVEKELARYKRYCIERNIVSLLEESQRRRREFIQRQIPYLIDTELGELDSKSRRQVEAVMKQLISDFSADSFNAIHETLERHWGKKL